MVPKVPPEDTTSAEVDSAIAAARLRTDEQLGELLEVYRGYLLKIAADGLSPELAVKVAPSDLVQEAMTKASTGFSSFRGKTEAELRDWLKQILLNSVIDADRCFRQAAKRDITREVGKYSEIEEGNLHRNGASSPLSHLARIEKGELVQAALKRLSVSEQELIRLKNFEQLSFREISEKLGCDKEAARKRWTRAIQHLELELRQHDIGFSSLG